MTWSQVVLGDVVRVARSGIPPQAIEAGTTYVGLEHIDSGGNFIGVRAVDPGELASTKFSFSDRHVLFGKLRPYLKKTARPDFEGVCSTDILPLEPGREVDRDYLFHVLRRQHFVDEVTSLCAGANLPRISPKVLASLKIPLPSLAEQRRIAAILDKADALRTKRREATAKLDQLLQSVFLDMFGDPVSNPKGWPGNTTLGTLVSQMQYGPRFYNEKYSLDGIRIVRITDLSATGNLDFDAMPRMDVDTGVEEQFALQSGDLIFARTGATVGKVALIKESDPPSIAGAYFIRMRFDDSVLPRYVFTALQAKSIQKLISVKSRQAAQQNFSGPGLRQLPMPVPPLELQSRFVCLAQRLDQQKRNLQENAEKQDALFASLQHRAFSGTL